MVARGNKRRSNTSFTIVAIVLIVVELNPFLKHVGYWHEHHENKKKGQARYSVRFY
jgi:hypothetical protein